MESNVHCQIGCLVTDDSGWLLLMTAARHIIHTVHSLPTSAMPITQRAIAKMQNPETEDTVRLLASEYLASSTVDKKTTQSWICLVPSLLLTFNINCVCVQMGSLLQFLKEVMDILFGSLEDESFQWDDIVFEDDKGYAIQTDRLKDTPILGIVKVH